jgi:hypothetical protein
MNRPVVLLAAVWAVWAAAPAAADPTVQQLQPLLPSTSARDQQFLADLEKVGMTITDVPTAIYGAHDTCAYLAAGHTASEAVETGLSNNASMSRADEIAYIDAAISVFCPQQRQLTGTIA